MAAGGREAGLARRGQTLGRAPDSDARGISRCRLAWGGMGGRCGRSGWTGDVSLVGRDQQPRAIDCRKVVPPPLERRGAMWFWGGIGCALVLGAIYRAPRFGHSFWNDEAYAARAYVMGESLPVPHGSFIFKPNDWKTTLFLNEKGNNHVWCSIEARVALKFGRRPPIGVPTSFPRRRCVSPPSSEPGDHLAALAFLGRLAGNWRAGLAAAWLLALHPWHVRYAVEMRGYSTNLLAVVLDVIFLIRALDDGHWRWWLAFAAAEVITLLSFAGSIYYPFTATVAAVVVGRSRDWIGIGRWAVSQALAASCFFGFSDLRCRKSCLHA